MLTLNEQDSYSDDSFVSPDLSPVTADALAVSTLPVTTVSTSPLLKATSTSSCTPGEGDEGVRPLESSTLVGEGVVSPVKTYDENPLSRRNSHGLSEHSSHSPPHALPLSDQVFTTPVHDHGRAKSLWTDC